MNNMDLQMILKTFWKKKSLIIVMFFIGLALGFSYSSLFIIPDYKTSVTFMLAKPGSQNNNSITSNDLNLFPNSKRKVFFFIRISEVLCSACNTSHCSGAAA